MKRYSALYSKEDQLSVWCVDAVLSMVDQSKNLRERKSGVKQSLKGFSKYVTLHFLPVIVCVCVCVR